MIIRNVRDVKYRRTDAHRGLRGMTMPAHCCITLDAELTAFCEAGLTSDLWELGKAAFPESDPGRRAGSETASLLTISACGGLCWPEPDAIFRAAADASSSVDNAAASPGL